MCFCVLADQQTDQQDLSGSVGTTRYGSLCQRFPPIPTAFNALDLLLLSFFPLMLALIEFIRILKIGAGLKKNISNKHNTVLRGVRFWLGFPGCHLYRGSRSFVIAGYPLLSPLPFL